MMPAKGRERGRGECALDSAAAVGIRVGLIARATGPAAWPQAWATSVLTCFRFADGPSPPRCNVSRSPRRGSRAVIVFFEYSPGRLLTAAVQAFPKCDSRIAFALFQRNPCGTGVSANGLASREQANKRNRCGAGAFGKFVDSQPVPSRFTQTRGPKPQVVLHA